MKMVINFIKFSITVLIILASTSIQASCGTATPTGQDQQSARLKVAATTTIIADVLRNIAGDKADVVALLPVGADPHSFQPTPQELASLSEVELIFINGAGLEEFLQPLLESANSQARQVDLSQAIELFPAPPGEEDLPGDPHIWTDPNLVMIWSDTIAGALSAADPTNAAYFGANAASYRLKLSELDAWVRRQVEQIPPGERKLVSDHQDMRYFAERYGFAQIGTLLPSVSTLSEPSAQELASLENAIQQAGVKAIFVGSTVSPKLADQVAKDTGVRVVTFYTGSLSDPSGPAGTYIEYIRYNVNAITEALK